MGNQVAAAVAYGNVTKTTRLPNNASIFRAELHATVGEILGKYSNVLEVVAEPLSADYFDQLSADIGDNWLRLADKLKLGRAAVQRIAMSNAHHGNAAQRSARDALVQWFRSSAKSHNRVRKLV